MASSKELRGQADIARADQKREKALAADCRRGTDHASRAAFHAWDAQQLDAQAAREEAQGR